MYSVEDLLISHGYKLPKNAPSPCEPASRYADCQREMAEKGTGHGTANGYETDTGAYVCGRQPPAKGYSSDNECKDRNQRRRAGNSGNQGDTQPLGDFLTRDSGFYDSSRGMYSQPRGERGVSYWRRRGQDFSILLDYADCRELRGSSFPRTAEGAWRSLAEERGRERPHWDEVEREAGREHWRVAEQRKCQSVGMEEWRPAALGRQLSDGESERWVQDQRLAAASEGAVDPRTRGKSLSLPRVLSPESLQYTSMPDQSTYGGHRLNGSFSHGPPHKPHGREWWPGNGHWPSGHSAPLPKPRFSRPLKPPSYEAHQQTRGSLEMLAGDQGPHPKDKGPQVPRQDYFAHEPVGPGMEPPVYIPPPSYERPLLQRGPQKNYGDISDFRLKGVPFQQVPRNVESGRWFSRPAGSSWLDQPRDRSAACRKQVRPGVSPDHMGWVQYLPFDDPRVRHISGGPCGSPLTDADKIRHINKELPSATVLEQSPNDSAFTPSQGLCVSAETDQRSLNEHNNGNRWYSGLHKESDNSIGYDQSCNKYQKDQSPTVVQTVSSTQSTNLDQEFPETVTQVKKIEPGAEGEKKHNSKKRLNETIFCLVSVPLHLQPNGESCDQNNNEKQSISEEGSSAQSRVDPQSLSQLSGSLTDLELQTLTSHSLRGRAPKKPPPGKDVAEPRPLQPKPNNHNELLYSGAWPGDQYRDQETQTSCHTTPKMAPQVAPRGPVDMQAQELGPPVSDSTTDSGVGSDCSTFGYPMMGQKSLKPSSNSAFSRTGNFPSKLSKSPAQPVPSGGQEEAGHSVTRRNEVKPSPVNGQEAFGQFMLKPVSRRPWDAIEELESFNKELQEQIGKRTSVDQCIEDLDQAYRDILELSTTSNNNQNSKAANFEHNPPVEEPPRKPSKAQQASERLSSMSNLDHGEVRSAFSRLPPKTVSFGKLPIEPGFRDYGILSQIPPGGTGDCRSLRSDIPVMKESLLQDVGLTVYTETQEGSRQPTQDACTLTSPPDYEEVCHALQLSRERGAVAERKAGKISASPHTSFRTFGLSASPMQQVPSPSRGDIERKVKKENLVSKYDGGEDIPEEKGQEDGVSYGVQHSITSVELVADRGTNRGAVAVSDEEDSGGFNWQKQLSLAEKHLEELLINEKANTLPKEDLSNLYEIQCAEGIPEKETIEERAARILGIAVPAESLAVGDQKRVTEDAEPIQAPETKSEAVMITEEPSESSADRKPTQVQSQYEEVSMEPVDPNGPGQEVEEVTEPEEGDRPSGELDKHIGQDLGVPELPPDKLVLSVAINGSNEEDKLSLRGGDDFQEHVGDSLAAEAPVEGKPELYHQEEMENLVIQEEVLDTVSCADNSAEAPEDAKADADLWEETEDLFLQVEETYIVSLTNYPGLTSPDPDIEKENEDQCGEDTEERETSIPQPATNDTTPSAPQPQPRNATVAKREITLPLDLSDSANEVEQLDEEEEEEVLSLPECYDPSRVERV